MSLTKTPICDFGKKAENFELKSTDNKIISLNDIKGDKGTLIMFICNHCPYVKAVIEDMVEDANKLENSGFNIKNKTKNEISLIIENNSITTSLKTILNNFDIEDLYINEPPIDEIIGKILIKKDYDI